MDKNHKTYRNLRIIYGALIGVALIIYMYCRHNHYATDDLRIIDKGAIVLFAIIVLLPFIQEIDIFGFKVKKELQKEIEINRKEILETKSEILNNLVQNSNVTNNYLLSDKNLEFTTKEYSSSKNKYKINNSEIDISMFKLKKEIVNKLIKIAEYNDMISIPHSAGALVRILINEGYIPDKLYRALMQTLMICNIAIHGQSLNKSQEIYIENTSNIIIEQLDEIIKNKEDSL